MARNYCHDCWRALCRGSLWKGLMRILKRSVLLIWTSPMARSNGRCGWQRHANGKQIKSYWWLQQNWFSKSLTLAMPSRWQPLNLPVRASCVMQTIIWREGFDWLTGVLAIGENIEFGHTIRYAMSTGVGANNSDDDSSVRFIQRPLLQVEQAYAYHSWKLVAFVGNDR